MVLRRAQVGHPELSAARKTIVGEPWKEGQSLSASDGIGTSLRGRSTWAPPVMGEFFGAPPPISLGSEHDGAGEKIPRPDRSLFTPAHRGLSRKTVLHRESDVSPQKDSTLEPESNSGFGGPTHKEGTHEALKIF